MKKSLLLSLVLLCSVTFQEFAPSGPFFSLPVAILVGSMNFIYDYRIPLILASGTAGTYYATPYINKKIKKHNITLNRKYVAAAAFVATAALSTGVCYLVK